jgi:FKBP-type peptidyl-prolyl cis-trans isomerase
MRLTHVLTAAITLSTIGSALWAQQEDTDRAAPAQPERRSITIGQPQPERTPIPVPEGEVVERRELEGGLIVEDIRIGDGPEVQPGAAVVAHYHGTLKEAGTVFDSSFQRGEPVSFPLSGVIPGWQKGVPGMKVGGVRRLIIPSEMGYGAQGAGQTIPPNSDLIFVIEIIDALRIEELEAGTGEDAFGQFVAVTAHTIKDESGNIVERSTREDPYIWIPGEFQGVQFGLDGMRTGGKRRIHVPAAMNQAPFGMEVKRPTNVPLEIEIELLAIRNLQPRQ